MTVRRKFETYLADLNPLIEQAKRDGVEPTPESARAALAGLNAFAFPPAPVSRVFESAVAYEDDAGATIQVPVRVYVPRPGVPSDVVFFVHGGGHMAGDLDVYDFSARRVAQVSDMVVVSVDYRRSPEAKFPTGLTDTYQALLGLDQALTDVATTGRIHGVADSGGAAKLTSIAMRTAAGEWASPIDRQVLLYPSVDYTMSGDTIQTYGTGYFLERDRIAWYFDQYFPAGVDRRAASPLFGPFDDAMPDTLVIAAEYDPLLSEARGYVDAMVQAGSAAHLIVVGGTIHAFTFFETLVPEVIVRTYEVIDEFLRTGDAAW